MSGALEQGDFASFTATDEDVREVLDSGLFSSRGDHRIGWAHQSYGEFLAALYLKDKGVPAGTILRVVIHPSGGVIPQLAVDAAWMASLSAELRASVIAAGPWELLHGDLANWPASDLELLTRSMLEYIEQGRYYEHFFGMGLRSLWLGGCDRATRPDSTGLSSVQVPGLRPTIQRAQQRCP